MHGNSRSAEFIAKLSIIASIWVLYARTLTYDFAYDDFLRIVGDGLVRGTELSWGNIRTIFTTATYPGDLFRPTSTLLHRIVHVTFGLNPHFYHAVQVVLHSLCALLVFELLMSCRLSLALSWCAAMWFAVHPVNVEAVANASGQPELLALFLGLAALFVNHSGALAADILKRVCACALSALLFMMAILAKESALVFLVLIPLIGWYRKIPASRLIYSWAWLIVSVLAALTLRKIALGDQFIVQSVQFLVSENPLLHGALGFTGRLFPATVTFGDYIAQLFLPLHLSSDYTSPPPIFWARIFSTEGILAASIPILLLLLVLRHAKQSWGAFGLWFFIAFALTLNVITPIGTLRGERLAYTPSVGFCAFIMGVIAFYFSRRASPLRPPILVATTIIILSAWRSYERMPVWVNQEALFMATVHDAPLSPKAIENAGSVVFDTYRDADRAERYFKRSLALDPTRVFSMKYLVNINILRGNLPEARTWCNRILVERPGDKEIEEKIAQIDAAINK